MLLEASSRPDSEDAGTVGDRRKAPPEDTAKLSVHSCGRVAAITDRETVVVDSDLDSWTICSIVEDMP